MAAVQITLESDLASVIQSRNQPMAEAACELMVFELYRRGTISSGKAAELLGMSRVEFIRQASSVGIPYFEMTDDEWAAEAAQSTKL